MTSKTGAVFLSLILALLHAGSASAQIKALLLTSPGIYHDYAYQSEALTAALARNIHIQFDVSLAETQRWQQPEFTRGYDVVIYNICMADNTDADLIANLRRQTEQHGVPAIVLHCTMHSFRQTDLWWPLYGLKTTAHEAIGEMPQQHARAHPVLAGVPTDWVVAHDELYINLIFEGEAVLNGMGENGQAHATAWTQEAKGSRIFGTTLGHSVETIEDPVYQRLLTNAVLWATGNLSDDGSARPGLAPNRSTAAIGQLSKAPGVDFYTDDQRSCMQWEIGKAIGPCLAVCTLHPLKWGDEADACRGLCFADIPKNDALADLCVP